MKIEKLSENKLKVTISSDDMLKWNVTFDTLLPDYPDAEKFIKYLIHKASIQTGIKLDDCRLSIDAIKESENSCIMIITKQTDLDSKAVRYRFSGKKKAVHYDQPTLVFSFSGIEDVINFAKNNLYYCFLLDGKNTLCRGKDGLMLVISKFDTIKDYIVPFTERICEYANLYTKSSLYSSYLNEYSDIIIKDTALKTIYYKM